MLPHDNSICHNYAVLAPSSRSSGPQVKNNALNGPHHHHEAWQWNNKLIFKHDCRNVKWWGVLTIVPYALTFHRQGLNTALIMAVITILVTMLFLELFITQMYSTTSASSFRNINYIIIMVVITTPALSYHIPDNCVVDYCRPLLRLVGQLPEIASCVHFCCT